MEAAVWRQESRVLLDVGGALFTTSRTTLTVVPRSMLEALFSGRHTIAAAGEDGWVFIDRDGEHFGLILNFLRDSGSDAAADAIRALPDAQLRVVRGELDYCGLGDAVFPDRFSLERASFVPGPEMCMARSYYPAVALPGDREALVIGGSSQARQTAVLDFGTMVFAPEPAIVTSRYGSAAVVLPDGYRALVVGGSSGATFYLPSIELMSLGTMAFELGTQILSP